MCNTELKSLLMCFRANTFYFTSFVIFTRCSHTLCSCVFLLLSCQTRHAYHEAVWDLTVYKEIQSVAHGAVAFSVPLLASYGRNSELYLNIFIWYLKWHYRKRCNSANIYSNFGSVSNLFSLHIEIHDSKLLQAQFRISARELTRHLSLSCCVSVSFLLFISRTECTCTLVPSSTIHTVSVTLSSGLYVDAVYDLCCILCSSLE